MLLKIPKNCNILRYSFLKTERHSQNAYKNTDDSGDTCNKHLKVKRCTPKNFNKIKLVLKLAQNCQIYHI